MVAENPDLSVKDIAEKVGCSVTYVYILCRKEDLPLRQYQKRQSSRRQKSPVYQSVVNTVKKHPKWRPPAIAEKLGCRVEYVYSVIRSEGLDKCTKAFEKQVVEYAKDNPFDTVEQIVDAIGGNYRLVKAVLDRNRVPTNLEAVKTHKCKGCGKRTHVSQLYCSRECYAVSRRGRAAYRQNGPKRGKRSKSIASMYESVALTCSGCGREFDRPEYVHNAAIQSREKNAGRKLDPKKLPYYCSMGCYHKYGRRKKSC
ncbi:MAG: hypothetical protein KatS3mg109_0158 [Pirellulaceae bacterium]|nr:MAG: hypothetical protein KatS3mg109_0158 [Pirellulaceae bacterium]